MGYDLLAKRLLILIKERINYTEISFLGALLQKYWLLINYCSTQIERKRQSQQRKHASNHLGIII